ncbi:MAG: YybH family protein [Gemmatimonadota bacterium]
MQIRTSSAAVLAASVLAVATACQPAAEQDGQQGAAVDTAAVMSALDSLRTTYEEAFAAGDVATMASTFTEDAIFSEPGAAPVTGRSTIREAMEEAPPPEGATLSLRPTETRVLTNDLVYEMGTGTVTFTPEGADEAQEMESSYLVILARTADGWKVSREVVSPNQPPSEGEM